MPAYGMHPCDMFPPGESPPSTQPGRRGVKRKAPDEKDELLGVQKRIASGIEMMVELFKPISVYYARKNAEFDGNL